MYLMEEMIDMGLQDGQKWPTPAHREVACSLALFNPIVTNRGTLTEIVQKVRKIPKSRIKEVSKSDLPQYGLSIVCGG
jgi:hypothetical protein